MKRKKIKKNKKLKLINKQIIKKIKKLKILNNKKHTLKKLINYDSSSISKTKEQLLKSAKTLNFTDKNEIKD